MSVIEVGHPAGSYSIYLEEGGLAQTGRWLAELGYEGGCAVITNETVGEHYAGPLLDSLRTAGFEATRIDIPDGEQFKTLGTVAELYNRLIEAGLDRRGPILALGGGVLGDTAGFAAASYLRGVPLVQMPTTLLSMVDASVGGKTGVDLPQGKNLVGAFKQPEMVVIDPHVLQTLPPAEFRAGLAEVIKHGIIDGPALFDILEGARWHEGRPDPEDLPVSMTDLLRDAIQVKVRVVQEDPFEQGRRAVLNLGHTFGHAFERLSTYKIRHGEGVAMGLVCAARLATRLGHCSGSTTERITHVVAQAGLPTEPPAYPPPDIWAAMATDKKRQGRALRFILPRAIGDVDIFTDIPEAEVKAIF
jgi:3-dehydroquinate synthase